MAADPHRLVTVSNRIAASTAGAMNGGLAVGLSDALAEHGGLWFGWDGSIVAEDNCSIEHRGNIEFVTIGLNAEDHEHYYNGYSNRVLWPICHGLPKLMHFQTGNLTGYRRVNARFAHRLANLLRPEDVIWVHDYHLIPLATELRRQGVGNPIGFFLHVPFPNPATLQTVPGRDYLLDCLCAYDVVGFQTDEDLASFRGALAARTIPIAAPFTDVYPIGVDVTGIQKQARRQAYAREVQQLTWGLDERKLIIGVDRLDYSKGLTPRLVGYERLQDRHPAILDELVLTQITIPTRTGLVEYAHTRAELEQTAARINARFGKAGFAPIRYLNQGINRPSLMGLFRRAAIGLVTPIRDGMNLVAKEYLAAQDMNDPGVLVLSRLAGAAHELNQAVIIDPLDPDDVADGIAAALKMPLDERRQRHADMLVTLRKNDITAWRRRFVDALVRHHQLKSRLRGAITSIG